MRVLLLSSFLYLLGVVLVLYFKPLLMFDKDGIWKEFGFSDSKKHSWFAFWLFCIVWAMLSFCIINFFFGTTKKTKVYNTQVYNTQVGNTAKPGYYVLDKEGSTQEGTAAIPRYVYLGPNIPTDNRDE